MALTYAYKNAPATKASAAQVSTGGNNTTDPFGLAPFQNVGVQMVWASVVGVQPQFTIQGTIDGTNWEDVSGTTYITTAVSGSKTFVISDLALDQIRVRVSTASTSGTLNVSYVGNGRAIG